MAPKSSRGSQNRSIRVQATVNEEELMKKYLNKRGPWLDHRDRQIEKLARRNPEYKYILDKKDPDVALPYSAWIQTIIRENRI
jgi:CTP-dependent riboflavin kinase